MIAEHKIQGFPPADKITTAAQEGRKNSDPTQTTPEGRSDDTEPPGRSGSRVNGEEIGLPPVLREGAPMLRQPGKGEGMNNHDPDHGPYVIGILFAAISGGIVGTILGYVLALL